ncbi:MAG: outer membrane beta-barrel protein [Myxococcales bacterium]|nr:MAG: outer membrane beta-barrel protein [Myxococcales bacterium]
MMRKISFQFLVLAVFVAAFAPFPASANFEWRRDKFVAGAGFGFTSGPSSLSLNGELSYFFTDNLSITPRFSLGLDNDFTLFLIMADLRYTFDIRDHTLQNLKPFVGFGAGISFINVDYGNRGDDSDAAFTFEIPFGFDYYFDDRFALGTQMEMVIPIDLFNDNFIFQWLVITGRYAF